MKKSALAPFLLCIFTAFTSLSIYAGATDSNGGTNSTAVSPNSRDMSTNSSADVSDSDDDDYDWIGLLGLIGLAGLKKRDRSDDNRSTSR